ncbi:MAG: hypothetical protein IPH59_03415 [bacterium]|nr:hypothetical protein [bacterium]
MPELLEQIVSIDPSGLLGNGLQYVRSHFGTPGVIAAAVLSLSILGLVAAKILKIVFDILRYVVLPSVVVTFIATFFLPYSFVNILPAAVAVFSVVLIVRG